MLSTPALSLRITLSKPRLRRVTCDNNARLMTPTSLHGAGYIKSFKGEKKTAAVSIFTDAFESFHFGEATICFAPASSVHYSMKYAAGEA